MSTREETERNVRIEQDDSARNGRNGKHLMEAVARSENSVEKSLEEFIARANSTFLDADGWDLTPEPAPEPPKPAPEPEPVAVPARVAATTVSPADVAKAVEATAVTEDAPIAAGDPTHVVAREMITPEPVVVTRTSWGGVIVAFLLGGGLVFGGMKYLEKRKADEARNAVQAAAAQPEAAATRPSAGPAGEEVTAVRPEDSRAKMIEAAKNPPGVVQPPDLSGVLPPGDAPPGTPGAPDSVPPQGGAPVVQPLVQPLPTETKPADPPKDTKADSKKDDAKKSTKKGDKKATKGGIVDPFGAAEEPKKKKDPPKKKKKDSAPKGGIVDPFAM